MNPIQTLQVLMEKFLDKFYTSKLNTTKDTRTDSLHSYIARAYLGTLLTQIS